MSNVALADAGMPAIYHGDIVFRTTPYNELGTHGWDRLVVFEVEELDADSRFGWAVVARGQCSKVNDPVLLDEIRRSWDPQSWASGPRRLYLRLAWDDLTGASLPQPCVGW